MKEGGVSLQCPDCNELFEADSTPDGHHERACSCDTFLQWDERPETHVTGGGPAHCEHGDRVRPGAKLPIPSPY